MEPKEVRGRGLFGELVFNRGPAGIGILWGSAGFGLIIGGVIAHRVGPRLSITSYKRVVAVCYLIHGAAYVLFSQAARFDWIAADRMGLLKEPVPQPIDDDPEPLDRLTA